MCILDRIRSKLPTATVFEKIIVGKAGQEQNDQMTGSKDPRNNKVNILIPASVNEEGLDVGKDDQIVSIFEPELLPDLFRKRVVQVENEVADLLFYGLKGKKCEKVD
ncbi:hypothetical protein QAD02_013613 [Eretmocerus hayati]|uniref:Uncharacterized protein n=1 Tax=Eretmocerus hayati TaxID=131215 RepID=A0ACC2P316_9HYME|nr:hypothetical protein QAD02_013613 [Eretmocerus hayati]